MKSYQGLTIKYLQKQFRRTLVTLIGIVLSVALITAIGVIGESIKATQVAQMKELGGDFHARFKHLTSEAVEVLNNHVKVEKTGMSRSLGAYEVPGQGVDLLLTGFDAGAIDIFGIKLVSGRLPGAQNELVIEEWLVDKLPGGVQIGDKLTIPYRNYYRSEDGRFHSLSGENEFLLVGVIKNTVAKATERALGLTTVETVRSLLAEHQEEFYVRVKDGYPVRETMQEIQQSLQIPAEKMEFNEQLLQVMGETEKPNWPLLFLALVVVVATVAAIYNILHISVMERIRQFGMLRSMGATPAQIRRIVLGEGLVLSLFGIPVGVGVGILLALGIVRALSIFEGIITGISVSPLLLVGIVGLSLLGIFFSTYSPARQAGKVSPLEAIKANAGVVKDSSQRQRQWHNLIRALTGITGKMAYQNLWRNRKRFLVTVFSITLGVVLFIVFGYFTTNANPENIVSKMIPGDYQLSVEAWNAPGYSRESYQTVAAEPGVSEVLRFQRSFGSMLYAAEEIPAAMHEELFSGPYQPQKDPETGKYVIQTEMFAYQPDVIAGLKQKLVAGAIMSQQIADTDVVLLVDELDEGGHTRLGLQVGDEVVVKRYYRENDQLIARDFYYTIGGIVTGLPINPGYSIRGVRLIADEALFERTVGFTGYHQLVVNVEEKADRAAIEATLQRIVKGVTGGSVLSYKEELEKLAEQKRQLMYLIYGLIGVVSLIGIVNIINTLSTNLILRTREFGTLRAVGMTNKQLRQMIRMEGIFYGVISAIWGSLLGVLLAYVLFTLLRNEMEYLTWLVPWKALALAWVGSIGIGLLATYAPLKRIGRMTIIDAVRTIE